jgi:tRNA (adenine58-N1)-methyltransferase non-catalytic subunit
VKPESYKNKFSLIMDETIKVGEYIVVQKHNFTKLHKFERPETTVTMGKDIVSLRSIEGQNFFKTYKMILTGNGGRKRLYELELCENVTDLKDILKDLDSGVDNRNIRDDGQVNETIKYFSLDLKKTFIFQSQTLSNEEIVSMRETVGDSKEIIETIIANSKSFNEKTEFSQEKYLKKKEKKYFEFIRIRKPTIRLITEIFYRQDPDKALGLRIDSLSQLISYSGVNSTGNYLIYESGTSGLVPACFLNSMGALGSAKLIHMHPGNFPQKQAVAALNLAEDHNKKCISVNIYSVLRQYYQDENEVVGRKRKLESCDIEEVPAKKMNIEGESNEIKEEKIPKWRLENQEAIEVLKDKVDSLTIVSREDPLSIFKELLAFVHPGRPFVIFHASKEVLMDCYTALKSMSTLVNVRLVSTFMRNYQVLPMRTHPAVQIQGNSGWILHGFTIKNERNASL